MVCGCASSPYLFLSDQNNQPDCLNYLVPKFDKILYNAQINVTGKHLSGLLIFKTMPDKTIRTVFTNEAGLTFFDFEFAENNFKVVYCMNKLNRKPVINQLKKDLGLIIRYQMQEKPQLIKSGNNELYFGYTRNKETMWYITPGDCSEITRIETASKRKKKIIVTVSGYNTTLPDTVYLEHQAFEFNISLQKIEN